MMFNKMFSCRTPRVKTKVYALIRTRSSTITRMWTIRCDSHGSVRSRYVITRVTQTRSPRVAPSWAWTVDRSLSIIWPGRGHHFPDSHRLSDSGIITSHNRPFRRRWPPTRRPRSKKRKRKFNVGDTAAGWHNIKKKILNIYFSFCDTKKVDLIRF